MVRIGAAAAAFSGVVLTASAAGHDGIHIVAPSAGTRLMADSTYTVEWTGYAEDSRVTIDLHYCGEGCKEHECGDWITSLCPYGQAGCPDSAGDYDIVMPEPMPGTSGGFYKVLVMDVNDHDNWDCSGEFQLSPSRDLALDGDADVREVQLPRMTVISPEEGDMAYAGDEYTVLFDYVDEVGSTTGRFNIDLYRDNGEGLCKGKYVTSICDKPSIGCKDSAGDYDIIMADVPAGKYTIRVSPFDNPAMYDCSGVFNVVGHDDEDHKADDGASYSFSYRF